MKKIAVATALLLLLLTGCWESDSLLLAEGKAARPMSAGTYHNESTGKNIAVSIGSDDWYSVDGSRVLFNVIGAASNGMAGFAYAAQEANGKYVYGIIFIGKDGEVFENRPDCDLPPDSDLARRAGAQILARGGFGDVCNFNSASSLSQALHDLFRRGPVSSKPTFRRIRSASAPAQQSTTSIWRDDAGNEVHYSFSGKSVVFSSNLPEGASFSIKVDGNQDGVWGDGPVEAREGNYATADLAFGQYNGIFCGDYIYTASRTDPDMISITSACGAYRSKGDADVSGFDAQNRHTITLKIPFKDLFSDNRNAHVQVCIYDGTRNNCAFGPSAPYVIDKPD